MEPVKFYHGENGGGLHKVSEELAAVNGCWEDSAFFASTTTCKSTLQYRPPLAHISIHN